MFKLTFLLLCFIHNSFADDNFYFKPIKIIDLEEWTVQYGEGSSKTDAGKWSSPNGIFTIAEGERIIKDVLFGFNDNSSKWIAKQTWTFTHTFSDDSLFQRENVILVFDGIDTIAEIKVNNKSLGKTENMFVQYIFDIKDHLLAGTNIIEVVIDSPLKAAEKANANLTYPIPQECPPPRYHGDCHINLLRKMFASFSTPEGPSAPSQGIWQPARIIGYKESYIQHIVTDVVDLNETFWRLNINVHLASNRLDPYIFGRMNLIFDGVSYGNQGYWIVDITSNEYGEIVWSYNLDFNKTTVEMWWPNGYGKQKLYNLTVSYYSSELIETHSKSVMVGFRTIELVQDSMGGGLTHYFKVNKVPIFIKGANLVPVDILPERVETKHIVNKLINDVSGSWMNMLKIWGGGTYGSDYLYKLADENGILIWQEFMFTDSFYPANNDFLSNVKKEVNYQVKRLYSHPSLALFSSNSAIERAFANNWYNITNTTVYRNDYVKLFVDTVRTECKRILDNKGIFVISTPSNGLQSEKESYLSENPNDEHFGDVYHFDYTSDPFNDTTYPIPRFVSAYGHQSLPNAETLLKQSGEVKYLSTGSDWLIYRQHQTDGYDWMFDLLNMHFKLPSTTSNDYDLAVIFYSEILQAQAVKLQTEHYRIYKTILNSDLKGNTMGAIYWQLNDVWSGPTFSAIDYYGRPKPVLHLLKNAFAPVIVTGKINGEDIDVYVVSDLLEKIEGATLKVQVYQWSSFTPVNETVFKETIIIPNQSRLVQTIDYKDLFMGTSCSITSCFFYLTLEKNDEVLAPNNYILPAKIKDSELTQHKITVSSVKELPFQRKIFEVTITSENIAIFVWLDSHYAPGKFSENGFLLVEPTKTVYFYSDKDTTAEDLLKIITVTHIRDFSTDYVNDEWEN